MQKHCQRDTGVKGLFDRALARDVCTMAMEHFVDERDGHSMGAHAVARDGVGARGESRSKRAEDAGWMLPLFTSAS
jgi:hypothetical protein